MGGWLLDEMKKYKTAALLAFHDMKPMINEMKKRMNIDCTSDNYVCTESYFHTIESRRMNRELGINLINYIGNTNGI